ncbi:MAG: aminoglycoside phosphotransferase family protein [Proteobacteria bacterium]|nr:aminoglycoside phosphotransferase family protein [Pseudomonadota bacterium]
MTEAKDLTAPAEIDPARAAAPAEAAPAFDLDRFLAVVSGILRGSLGPGELRFQGSIAGNINRIYRFSYAGRPLGARVALNRDRFKYEKDIIKEVFAILLLQHAGEGANDRTARRIVEAMLVSPTGAHVGHAGVRSILHYDWSMTRFPYPFFVFEWVEGEVLWLRPDPAHYAGAGEDLARLHRIGFAAFYRDIFAAGREPLAWAERFRGALAPELAKARAALPAAVVARLESIAPESMAGPSATFVHNDYSGANIIVGPEGRRRIIDWDNWVIDAAELDLIKMKYWTAVGPEGRLVHEPNLFAAFREGYRRGGGRAIDERRLWAYEGLWLLRAYNFESAKRAGEVRDETDWARVYPGPEAYVAYLDDLVPEVGPER